MGENGFCDEDFPPLNSSSSSSTFGSFILYIKTDDNGHITEDALYKLSSLPDCKDSILRSGSDDRVFYLGGGGGGSNDQLVVQYNLRLSLCCEVWLGPGGSIIGSCNGLVCLQDSDCKFSIWNPATRQSRILPEPIITCHYLPLFGFDVKTKDYKVVRLINLKSKWNGHGPDDCFFKVQVYSLSTNSWKILEGITCLPGHPFFFESSCDSSVLYLNGSSFFLAHFFHTKHQPCLPENDRFIISFDFSKEIITPIQLPDHHGNQELFLCYFGDTIALFIAPRFIPQKNFGSGNDTRIGSYEDFNIWVLNEHCISSSSSSSSKVNKESWTKLHSFQMEIKIPYESYIPRGISNDGKFALLETRFPTTYLGKEMYLYNLVTKEMKNLLSGFGQSSKAYAYKPSPVSIIGGDGAAAAAADRVIGNGATNL